MYLGERGARDFSTCIRTSTIASMSIELRLLVDEAAGGVEAMGSDASLIVGLASKKPLDSLSSEARATAPPQR